MLSIIMNIDSLYNQLLDLIFKTVSNQTLTPTYFITEKNFLFFTWFLYITTGETAYLVECGEDHELKTSSRNPSNA